MNATDIEKDSERSHSTKKLGGLITSLVLTLFILPSHAQPPLADNMEIGLFRNSTTWVVIQKAWMAYSINVKNSMKEYWTITDYEFIDQDEFEDRRHNTKYSAVTNKNPYGFTRKDLKKIS